MLLVVSHSVSLDLPLGRSTIGGTALWETNYACARKSTIPSQQHQKFDAQQLSFSEWIEMTVGNGRCWDDYQ